MSFCRFGLDGSDTYVFESCEGGIECCACALATEPCGSFTAETPEEMIAHLGEHRRAGHFVPPYAIEGLWDAIPGAHQPVTSEPEAIRNAREQLERLMQAKEPTA